MLKKNSQGLVVCNICGGAFKKLGAHTYQAHGTTIAEYKEMFGINRNARTTSDDYADKMRGLNSKYFDIVVKEKI